MPAPRRTRISVWNILRVVKTGMPTQRSSPAATAILHADGGPLGIDHRWNYDNSGIWKRSNQDLLRYGALAADVGLALWEGDGSRLGRSAWQSVDSVALAGVTAEAAKRVFGRERPRDTNDPDQWFKSGN